MLKSILSLIVLGIGFSSFSVIESRAQTLLKDGKIPDDLIITLERTRCFGSCAEYELIITSNGGVVFVGKGFTKTKGVAQGKITENQIREIIAEFEKVNFFKLRNNYRTVADGCNGLATDLPYQIISIQINGKSKKVDHYLGCFKLKGNQTELLTALGRKIDEITNSNLWIE